MEPNLKPGGFLYGDLYSAGYDSSVLCRDAPKQEASTGLEESNVVFIQQ